MPNKDQFNNHQEYLQYYREYQAKNREKLNKYSRERMRVVRALKKREIKLSTKLLT